MSANRLWSDVDTVAMHFIHTMQLSSVYVCLRAHDFIISTGSVRPKVYEMQCVHIPSHEPKYRIYSKYIMLYSYFVKPTKKTTLSHAIVSVFKTKYTPKRPFRPYKCIVFCFIWTEPNPARLQRGTQFSQNIVHRQNRTHTYGERLQHSITIVVAAQFHQKDGRAGPMFRCLTHSHRIICAIRVLHRALSLGSRCWTSLRKAHTFSVIWRRGTTTCTPF